MYIDDFIGYVKSIDKRLATLENETIIKQLNLADNGQLILPTYTADPASNEASVYYNSSTNEIRYYDGTEWLVIEGGDSPQGPQGYQGYQGAQGSQGSIGNQGNQGQIGNQGNQGNNGTNGVQGNDGANGAQGNQGTNGSDGVQGNQGYQGIDGNQGSQGNQGNQSSVAGVQGNQGSQGSQGVQGTQDHNALSNLQGGTTDEYYHLTSAQATVVGNTSGVNTGDQTNITGNAGTVTNGVYTTGAGTVFEVPLTFSDGVTRTTNTIKNNLITGVSGGQTIIGGTASGNNLTLSSTSNATKGVIKSDAIQITGGASPTAGAGLEMSYVSGVGYLFAYDRDATSYMPFVLRGSYAEIRNGTQIALSTESGSLYLRSSTNATTGIQLRNSAGTAILNVDTTNSRVGIGTTSPGAKLEINEPTDANAIAFITARGGANRYAGLYFRTQTSVPEINGGAIGTEGSLGGLRLAGTTSLGTAHMYINAGGNVGIGTTSPVQPLHVSRPTNSGYTTLQVSNPSIATNQGFVRFLGRLGYTASVEHDVGSIDMVGTNNWNNVGISVATSAMHFRLQHQNTFNEKMTILSNGNVGIGTTNPVFQLESVFSSTSTNTVASSMRLVHKSTNNMVDGFGSGFVLGIDDTANSIQNMARIAGVRNGADNTGKFVIDVATAGTLDTKVTVLNTGNVGIGTTSPTGQLHIDQSSTTGAKPVLLLDQADVSEEFIEFVSTSAANNTNPISTTAVGTYAGKYRINVNGTYYWTPFYNA